VPLKPVYWVGSSLDDLRECPEEVQDVVGYALFLAQGGGQHPAAKRQHEGRAMKITKSNGNVFADLRLPDAEERLLKAQLAAEIARIIAHRKLTQRAAAELVGADQPKVSHLLHGRLAGFSTDRLLAWLTALGQDVEIFVRTPPRRRQGQLRVRILAAR